MAKSNTTTRDYSLESRILRQFKESDLIEFSLDLKLDQLDSINRRMQQVKLFPSVVGDPEMKGLKNRKAKVLKSIKLLKLLLPTLSKE